MKIRGFFVSNSSSSSFIVAFDDIPKTPNELKKKLFTEDQETYGYDFSDTTISTEAASKLAFDALHEIDYDEAINAVCCGYVEEIYNKLEQKIPSKYIGKVDISYWVERDKVKKEIAKEYLDKFLSRKDVVGKKLMKCEFSDNTEIGAMMEHGDLFQRVPYIRISYH